MDRTEFRRSFGSKTAVVLPVIHVIDVEQTGKNIALALRGGCKGVFLINHDFAVPQFLPIIGEVRAAFPDLWLGVNFLAVTGRDAFPVLADLERHGTRIDAYWADDARIDESRHRDDQPEAQAILETKRESGWNGIYFGGTAFKKQREVDPLDYGRSAEIACGFMDVVTTSGAATGKAADPTKIVTFRQACGSKPIALASGVTLENAHHYAGLVDCLMVATGINMAGDFYNIDPNRLEALQQKLGD